VTDAEAGSRHEGGHDNAAPGISRFVRVDRVGLVDKRATAGVRTRLRSSFESLLGLARIDRAMTTFRTLVASTALVAVIAAAGCYAPDGGFMPASGRGFTYVSTPMKPLTITLVDVRTEEPFFAVAIPPGQQLTFRFLEGKGDDPVWTPDRMQWELYPKVTTMGQLSNQMTCPPASCRRIDVSIRQAPEDPEVQPHEQPLTRDPDGKPVWWTPEGGPLPESDPRIYD